MKLLTNNGCVNLNPISVVKSRGAILAFAITSGVLHVSSSAAQTEQIVDVSTNSKCVPSAFTAMAASATVKIIFRIPDQNCEFIEYATGDVTPTVKLGQTGSKEFSKLSNSREFATETIPTSDDKLYVSINVRKAGSSDAFGYPGSGTVELSP